MKLLLHSQFFLQSPRYGVSISVMDGIRQRCISRSWQKDSFQAFLPNLTLLAWRVDNFEDYRSAIDHFSIIPGPNLRKFRFDVGSYFSEEDRIIFDALAICITSHPYLEELEFAGFDGVPLELCQSRLPSLVAHLQGLKHLCQFYDITNKAMSHLSPLSTLKPLDISLPRNGSVYPLQTNHRQFPVLTSLELASTNLESFTDLLNLTCSTSLARFRVECENTDASQFTDLLDALSRHSSLESIEISDDRYPLETFPDPEHTSTSSTFKPLLQLPNITSLRIDVQMGFDIDDTIIIAMTETWPQLVVLSISPGRSLPTPPRVTLQAISAIFNNCPSLEVLHIAFLPWYPAAEKKRSTNKTRLQSDKVLDDLIISYWSPIEDAVGCAETLASTSSLFPLYASFEDVGSASKEIREQWKLLEKTLDQMGDVLRKYNVSKV